MGRHRSWATAVALLSLGCGEPHTAREPAPAMKPTAEPQPTREPAPAMKPTAEPQPDPTLRLERLYRELIWLAEERRYDELVAAFTELRRVIEEELERGTLTAEEVRLLDARWFGDTSDSIRLQHCINRGNAGLRTMQQAMKGGEFWALLDAWRDIAKVVADMRSEEREVFHQNADALALRAQSLIAAGLPLAVTPLVGPQGPAAVCVNGVTLWPGHAIELGRGSHRLRVIAISADAVTLRLNDQPWTWTTAAPPAPQPPATEPPPAQDEEELDVLPPLDDVDGLSPLDTVR